MARKSTEGAVAEKPTRTRKSPKQKAESLTIRACNAIDSLGYMAERLTEPQREAIYKALQKRLADLDITFQKVGEEPDEPEPFSLPD